MNRGGELIDARAQEHCVLLCPIPGCQPWSALLGVTDCTSQIDRPPRPLRHAKSERNVLFFMKMISSNGLGRGLTSSALLLLNFSFLLGSLPAQVADSNPTNTIVTV